MSEQDHRVYSGYALAIALRRQRAGQCVCMSCDSSVGYGEPYHAKIKNKIKYDASIHADANSSYVQAPGQPGRTEAEPLLLEVLCAQELGIHQGLQHKATLAMRSRWARVCLGCPSKRGFSCAGAGPAGRRGGEAYRAGGAARAAAGVRRARPAHAGRQPGRRHRRRQLAGGHARPARAGAAPLATHRLPLCCAALWQCT